MRVLAIDAATTTGWATNCAGLESGRQSFPAKRGESPGMRYIRFRLWLQELLRTLQPEVVVYEAPAAHHPGAHAAEIAYALSTRVQELAAEAGVECTSLAPTALKRFATGSGGAKKEAMKDAAEARFPHYDRSQDGCRGEGGDEADALLLMSWALEGFPEFAPARKARRKAAEVAR